LGEVGSRKNQYYHRQKKTTINIKNKAALTTRFCFKIKWS